MPLIVMCGMPCSGKTTLVNQIYNFLMNEKQISNIAIISIESLEFNKNTAFINMESEKMTRQSLKAAIERKLSKESWVVMDTMNMIKGERYEMHCIARAIQTPMCVVFCDVLIDTVVEWNNQRLIRDTSNAYTSNVLNNLLGSLEIPDSHNRWDYPLFTYQPLSTESCLNTFDYEEMYRVLSGKALTNVSLATRHQQLQSSNFLHELDESTQHIVTTIISAQQLVGSGNAAGEVRIPSYSKKAYISRYVLPNDLRKIKREFTDMMKARYNTTQTSVFSIEQLGNLFIDYLNDHL